MIQSIPAFAPSLAPMHTPTLPFAHLNLRRNPFSQPRPDEWAKLAVVDVERWVPRIRRGGFVLQLMGHCGRGKSTHMRALHAHFSDAPYIYIPEDGPRPTVPLEVPILFVDESQRLGWWTRRKLWRRVVGGMGLVVGTHRDHSSELQRAGAAFEAQTIAGLDAARLRAIIERRLEWSRRAPGPIPWIEEETIEALLERFGDDMRAIGRILYELFQRMETIGPVPWPPPDDLPLIPESQHAHEGGIRVITSRHPNLPPISPPGVSTS